VIKHPLGTAYALDDATRVMAIAVMRAFICSLLDRHGAAPQLAIDLNNMSQGVRHDISILRAAALPNSSHGTRARFGDRTRETLSVQVHRHSCQKIESHRKHPRVRLRLLRRTRHMTRIIQAIASLPLSCLCLAHTALAQSSALGSATGSGVVTVVPIAPSALAPGQRNSVGWNTGYSAITTTSERPNILGRAFGGSDTIHETTTRVVPNDALGNPLRYGGFIDDEPNSAGWHTGYSAVTSTYQRPDPFGALAGGSGTVTETKTQILPNDGMGRPIRPFGGLWP
jgi:hypothetical protein